MNKQRVVVTGMAALTALGSDWPSFRAALQAKRNAVRLMPEWQQMAGLNTALAAPIRDFVVPANYSRKNSLDEPGVASLGTRATELALADAGAAR